MSTICDIGILNIRTVLVIQRNYVIILNLGRKCVLLVNLVQYYLYLNITSYTIRGRNLQTFKHRTLLQR